MDNREIQILGLCRFSVPSIGAFQSVSGTLEEKRALLYDPARLDARLAWFSHVCLPALRLQSDRSFTLVLLLGEDLPDPWRGRLLDLVADIPEIVVEVAPPGPHREICAAAMRRHRDPAARFLAQFRLDDDDAVAVDFIERLRQELTSLGPALNRYPNLVLDYTRGLVLRWDGEMLSWEPRLTRQWTPGLVWVTHAELDRFILDAPHNRMWKRMPVLMLPAGVMFVRGAHGGNDSRVAKTERFDLGKVQGDQLLLRRFGIDVTGFGRALLDIAQAET